MHKDMKLYGQITSERASKGQGGNEFLSVQILDKNQNAILDINVRYKDTGHEVVLTKYQKQYIQTVDKTN
jgi:phosphoribosylamine-glycine ligase